MALIFVSLGSNIERYKHIAAALDALEENFGALAISRVYESKSVGFDGSNFLNLAVGFYSELAVGKLSRLLRQIESDNGRRRDGPKYSARTLDIDILTVDDLVGAVDGVDLPREEITQNAFVLWPLVDIAAEKLHPSLNTSYTVLWKNYDQTKQKLWPVEFEWRGELISRS